MGDSREARRFARQLLELTPEADNYRWVIEVYSLELNEPRSVVENLSNWEPTAWFEARIPPGWWYFRTITTAHHVLEDYEAELREARRGQGLFENVLQLRQWEVRALSALGEVEQIQAVVDESMTIAARDGRTPGDIMRSAATELRVHGRPEAGQALAERALQWHRDRPQQQQTPHSTMEALVAAQRWQEALGHRRAARASEPGRLR